MEKKSNEILMSENNKLLYERRFGKIFKVNNIINNMLVVKKDGIFFDFKSNKMGEVFIIMFLFFFVKFLKIIEKEWEMMNFFYNYIESNGMFFGLVLNII